MYEEEYEQGGNSTRQTIESFVRIGASAFGIVVIVVGLFLTISLFNSIHRVLKDRRTLLPFTGMGSLRTGNIALAL